MVFGIMDVSGIHIFLLGSDTKPVAGNVPHIMNARDEQKINMRTIC